ncbi:hypothetical protein [Lutibaculum baratangense]|uniref:DUF1835 domain-containing protein n=1 Tax=Lutibaculum baratangense AMV1 TaxID=631454 RepID=V4RBI1_9HYPH|nr:hypothetical protein [Lutibaculum baratangense]ESR23501.1 hypothetical protein N177_3569 [Lutibaculum baratangense AMV1]
MERLIITNGDVAAERLLDSGVGQGAVLLPWRDVLHEGPVPAGLSLEELSAVRGEFIAAHMGHDVLGVLHQFRERDAALRSHEDFDRIELWFEHDLYDQLQLLQVLDFFAVEDRIDGLFLMQSDQHLGRLEGPEFEEVFDLGVPVTADMLEEASAAWNGFASEAPVGLPAFAAETMGELVFLAPALQRFLCEFPAPDSGLGLTEERVLRALAAAGEEGIPVGELFRETQSSEEAEFLGDTSFFLRLDALQFVSVPLIEGLPFESVRCADGPETADYREFATAVVTLTEAGEGALEGEFDHALSNGISRWFGGTHMTPDNLWRWDREDERLIGPDEA